MLADGTYEYPFAQHERWMFWTQNTIERHRFQQQKRICIGKLPNQITGMDMEELNASIDAGNADALRAVAGKMQMFTANILGSNAYFAKGRCELQSLMGEKGMPTMWFTLSAADNHWEDLHVLSSSMGTATATPFMSEAENAKNRRKWIRKNPHMTDSYFHARAKKFIETYFSDTGLNSEWYWFRIEYQKRGCPHIHGCCRLKSDPGLHKLSQKFLHSREAQKQVLASEVPLPMPCFHQDDLVADEFAQVFENLQLPEAAIQMKFPKAS